MKLEWKEAKDANSDHAYEAKVGRFVLRVRFTGSDTPWDAWLYAEDHREDDRKASSERVTLGWSINHIGQRFAIMAAEKMLDSYIAPFVATARAEAALAEREACAGVADDEEGIARRGSEYDAEIQSRRIAAAIAARTTTATLSTDTLAAIAEARGLRLVEPELVEVPVLRWVADGDPGWSRAEVSGWEVSAGRGNWALTHCSGASKLSPRPNRASEQDNRRAAEDALRSMGVAFCVEEDGAK